MLGAIIGDIVGSVYEFDNILTKDFPLFSENSTFTDDSVMTIALANNLLLTEDKLDPKMLTKFYQLYGRSYPNRGYGGNFLLWLYDKDPEPYNSFGNGSAMRVSPVAYVGKTLDEVNELAKQSAVVSHNHPEGIKGAQAIASSIFLAKEGKSKEEIKNYIIENFYPYDFGGNFTIDKIKPEYGFYESCQESVPQAIEAFLEGKDFEDVIRIAISLGGDSDTIAAMAGSIAEAYYGIPKEIEKQALSTLDLPLRVIVEEFRRKYI